ncbi:MAG: Flp family type IVb pilin [Phycisphaerales bacterium]
MLIAYLFPLAELRRRTDGASIVEYALLAALIGLALAVVVAALGEPIGFVFTRAAEAMDVE